MSVSELEPVFSLHDYDPAESVEHPQAALVGGVTLEAYVRNAKREPLLTAKQEVELAQRMELGTFAEEILADGIESHPKPQGPAEIAELEYVAAAGRQARTRMVEANLRLVLKMANRYYKLGHGVDLEDIIQDGNAGLIEAVQRFDYTKGYKFSTYATLWIKKTILEGRAEQSRTIKIKERALATLDGIMRTSSELYQTLGREPSHEEIAAARGMEPDKVREMLKYAPLTRSLNVPINPEDATELGDILPDEAVTDPLEIVLSQSTPVLEIVRKRVATLHSPRDAAIVETRLGLRDGRPRTNEEVGQLFNLSRVRIRQIVNPMIMALRQDPSIIELRWS